MFLFLTLIVAATAFNKEGLMTGLRSTEGQLKLFNQWISNEHANYGNREKQFRFRVFRKHLKEIVEINNAQDDYELDANFMAGLTEEEQQQHYGINITALPVEIHEADAEEESRLSALPTSGSVLWREQGKITAVKNQGSCGSCWAFAGIATFEGHYAIKTGALKRFSEQEFLDCTYEGVRDGCVGGWYYEAYDMLKKTQHLSLEADYSYTARDGYCYTTSKPNGMTAAAMLETVQPSKARNDASLVQALQIGPVAMAFEIKGGFNYYKTGVLSIYNCGNVPHHAMAVTGYTPEFFEIKNSWGASWGDRGYVRFSRSIENMCGISNWLSYPKLKKTGDDVDPTDVDPTDVIPPTDDGGDTTCEDKNRNCPGWAQYGECAKNWQYMAPNCRKSCGICPGCNDAKDYRSRCPGWKNYCTSHEEFMTAVCAKTCNKCTDDGDDGDDGDTRCPEGLKWCDGECKHEHFC